MSAGTLVGGGRVRLLLPPGWVRLPADDPGRSRRAVDRLLASRLAHLPRDSTATARRALASQLADQLGDARRAGASEVHALVDLLRGLPVTAGLTVVPLPAHDSATELVAALRRVLGEADGVLSTGTATVGGLPALRRHRRVPLPADPERPDRPAQHSTHLDLVVTMPDGDFLVLAFSTQTDPVAAQLVELFDAIADSLQLVDG